MYATCLVIGSIRCAPRRGHSPVTYFATPQAFRDYFKSNYGPTISAYRFLGDDPDRVAALDQDLVELARRFDVGSDTTVLDWEYLLFIARKVD
jgi:hypothetical protein